MAKAYDPEKVISDNEVLAILGGRRIDENEANRLLEDEKVRRNVTELTAEDVKNLLALNADDFNENGDLKWGASSGAHKFGERPRTRKQSRTR